MAFELKQELKNKVKVLSLATLPGDEELSSPVGSTLLLSHEKYNANVSIIVGRYNNRPDINKDSATFFASEYGRIDKLLLSSLKSAPDRGESSLAIINADKLRLNSKVGSISITSSDNLFTTCLSNRIDTVGGDMELTVSGNVKINVVGNAEINVSGDIKSKSKNLLLEANNNVKIKAGNAMELISPKVIVDGRDISLGKNATQPMVLGNNLVNWAQIHAHISVGGSPISPIPTTPTTTPATLILSRNVRVK